MTKFLVLVAALTEANISPNAKDQLSLSQTNLRGLQPAPSLDGAAMLTGDTLPDANHNTQMIEEIALPDVPDRYPIPPLCSLLRTRLCGLIDQKYVASKSHMKEVEELLRPTDPHKLSDILPIVLTLNSIDSESVYPAGTEMHPKGVKCVSQEILFVEQDVADRINYRIVARSINIGANVGPELTEAGIYALSPDTSKKPDSSLKNPAWNLYDRGVYLDQTGRVNARQERKCRNEYPCSPSKAQCVQGIQCSNAFFEHFRGRFQGISDNFAKSDPKNPLQKGNPPNWYATTMLLELRNALAALAYVEDQLLTPKIRCPLSHENTKLFYGKNNPTHGLSFLPFPSFLQVKARLDADDDRELSPFGMLFGVKTDTDTTGKMPIGPRECPKRFYSSIKLRRDPQAGFSQGDFSCIPISEQMLIGGVSDTLRAWMTLIMGYLAGVNIHSMRWGWKDRNYDNRITQKFANFLAAMEVLLQGAEALTISKEGTEVQRRTGLLIYGQMIEGLFLDICKMLPEFKMPVSGSQESDAYYHFANNVGLSAIYNLPDTTPDTPITIQELSVKPIAPTTVTDCLKNLADHNPTIDL
jgi:hypothetical protein